MKACYNHEQDMNAGENIFSQPIQNKVIQPTIDLEKYLIRLEHKCL